MNRFVLTATVAAAAVLTLAGCSATGARTTAAEAPVAVSPAGVPVSTGTGTEPAKIITTGTGKVTATPDVMTVVLGVDTRAATAAEALNQNNALATDVIAVLKGSGIADADLQTSQLSVNPAYDDKGRIDGYQVTNAVTATLRDISAAGTVLDAVAGKAGDAVRVRQVGFSIGDDSAQRAAARAAAVTQARTQAEQLATAAGVRLGDVVSITETTPGSPITYLPAAAMASDGATPVEAGSLDVDIVVQVVYAIAP